MNTQSLADELEIVVQAYAKAFKITPNAEWLILKLQEELGEVTQSYLQLTRQARVKNKSDVELKANFDQEVADLFCFVLLVAKTHKVDLEKVIQEKWLIWNVDQKRTSDLPPK